MQKFITVRMEEGEAPVVKVFGRGSYHHIEQGITVPTGVAVEVPAPDGLAELLEAVIAENADDVNTLVREAEVTDAAASLRQAKKARKAAAGG